MSELNFYENREIADKIYRDANCKYNGNNYIYHIDMVIDCINNYKKIFKQNNDYINTLLAGLYHDTIEDAKQSYNDILSICGKDVADITLRVTDVPAENRLMRHLLTMHKTVGDHRAIILKMCDIHANAGFSKTFGSGMFKKYKREYPYRRSIFMEALKWYTNELNMAAVDQLWDELDEIHDYKTK